MNSESEQKLSMDERIALNSRAGTPGAGILAHHKRAVELAV